MTYRESFYRNRYQDTVESARKILPIVLDVLPKTQSAIDVGCGVGTWLSALEELGVKDLCGLEGSWVDKRLMRVQDDKIRIQDLSEPIRVARKYDFAMSLEVAEHLPKKNANTFVHSLCGAADFVLFSAAIPGQGGLHHVNEQWPTYWIRKFMDNEFVAMDIVRKRIFHDENVQQHYRQNIFLFVQVERLSEVSPNLEFLDTMPPELYLLTYKKITDPGIRESMRNLMTAITRRVFRF